MHFLIYKTTNLINERFYIGAPRTNEIDDGYMGSGKHLRHAIKKYGIKNFKRDILFDFDNKDEMFAKELEIVDEDFVKDKNTYNLKIGGSGGNPGIIGAFSGRRHSEESKRKMSISIKLSAKVCSDETRLKLSINSAVKNNPNIRQKISATMTNRICSETHRKNVALANIGKIVVNNGNISKRISCVDLEDYLKNGWIRGMLRLNKSQV